MNRRFLDRAGSSLVKTSAVFSTAILFLITLGLLLKSIPILTKYPLPDLLFSSAWRPSKGEFGFHVFIQSTIIVTFLSMLFSVPLCVLSAIYLAEYAKPRFRGVVKSWIDLLASVPSVVFGLWGVLFIVPFIRDEVAPVFGVTTSGYCVLSGALVLAVMVVPIMISLMEEVFMSVPQDAKEASLSVGATRWETIKRVTLPLSAHGVISAVILGFSRAFGETMAVLMVVGNVMAFPKSIFDAAYPLTALIANNYGEMLSIPMYDSALMFASFVLLLIVVVFNLAARVTLRKFQVYG